MTNIIHISHLRAYRSVATEKGKAEQVYLFGGDTNVITTERRYNEWLRRMYRNYSVVFDIVKKERK